jgi:hypothetical protein
MKSGLGVMKTRPILLCLDSVQLSCPSHIAVSTQSTHEFECHMYAVLLMNSQANR